MPRNPDVLISGASVSGPVLAYWLRRHGFRPTVVERKPVRVKSGGHGVDLFGAGIDVVDKMAVLEQIEAAGTRNEWSTILRPGKPSIDIEISRLATLLSDRHVEIMLDQLGEILYERSRDGVEYLFGDSIRSMEETDDGVEVSFEGGETRRFDLVIGADGLHSNVRRLTFGEESRFRHDLGAAFAVYTLPNRLALHERMLVHYSPGRVVTTYGVRGTDEARAVFVFRFDRPYDHRDVAQQMSILREEFAASRWSLLAGLLDEMETSPAFYFDTIAQIRMERWSAGRVSLVGDAGYSPGPVVGGSTSLAVVGAYVLAGELAAAGGDHTVAFRRYENAMRPYVRDNRAFAERSARTLLPDTRFEMWRNDQVTKLIARLPLAVVGRIPLGGAGFGALDDLPLPDYAAVPA